MPKIFRKQVVGELRVLHRTELRITHEYAETEFPSSRLISPRYFSRYTEKDKKPWRVNNTNVTRHCLPSSQELPATITIEEKTVSAACPGKLSVK
ncbi:hypothetical protein T265_09396 [Opisthorchis viverrini]|uniref:Uncharacterized protein n=1 Tax=Opisthorchis viverrini TaxID=6198 RepID=A0A074Z5W3_OPIVI|nr:hypothetical protein T265_09396 [Opisthorchis viverrini]KER22531.1 hypothetical protein T265_09396 [Opisthorchis viverrini]